MSAANASNLQRSGPLCVWGRRTKDDLEQLVDAAYDEIIYLGKNLFLLPSGAAGKSFVREAERLISDWNSGSQKLYDISLKLVMIMPGLLLQKPSFKSTSKEHAFSFARRLQLWEQGDFDELLRECRTIQAMPTATRKVSNEQLSKTFASLIFGGKVNAALRLLDDQSSGGVLPLTDEVYQDLRR